MRSRDSQEDTFLVNTVHRYSYKLHDHHAYRMIKLTIIATVVRACVSTSGIEGDWKPNKYFLASLAGLGTL
jgi:hypothetical protein